MAYSIQREVSDGTLQTLTLRIAYFKKTHIFVYVDDKIADGAAGYSWVWDGERIRLNKVVPVGIEVMIRRKTPMDTPFHNFRQGAVFKDVTMDENFIQQLYINQENVEGLSATDFYSDLDLHNYRMKNVGTAISDADAVSLGQYRADALGANQYRILAEGSKVAAKAAEVAANASQLSAKASEDNSKVSEVKSKASEDNANTSATVATAAKVAADASANAAKVSELEAKKAAELASQYNGLFTQAGTGAVTRTAQDKMREIVSVKDFGAKGDGVTNDTVAIQNAISTGKEVYLPAGTYKCNVVINAKTVLRGDGSTSTLVIPFNTAVAAFTYTYIGDYWTYHSEVRGIGFRGTAKVGVGFTFGGTTQTDYFTNAEYANGVKFYGCSFRNLEKGVQFPFGNIGAEFYSCGFQDNKYGVYTKDNSASAGMMHAGCKTFYAGEFSSNDCGFYCSNATVGFGGISFNETIFEYNQIALYFRTLVKHYAPAQFSGVWFEGNGVLSKGAATVSVDFWDGATLAQQVLPKRSIVLDGKNGRFIFDKCGLFTDVHVKGTYIDVIAENCAVESKVTFSGGTCTVDNPTSSNITLERPDSSGGVGLTDGVTVVGAPSITYDINYLTAYSVGRPFIAPARSSKVQGYGGTLKVSAALTTPATLGGGNLNVAGTVVSDGVLYNKCNEFSVANFTASQYTRLLNPDSNLTTTAGWYVFTVDFKRIAGNPQLLIWDRATSQFVTGVKTPTIGKWYTFAAIGYSAGAQQLYLDFNGGGVVETCTWRLSAYQMHRFDTLAQAKAFVESGVFAE